MQEQRRKKLSVEERLIVALDVPGPDDALRLIQQLGSAVSIYKIGYRLGYAGGLGLVRRLVESGLDIFLDFKLLDIGNTVKEGVEALIHTGARFLTVHAYPQAMRAAVEARGFSSLNLLAVGVLTSYDRADLLEAGYTLDGASLATQRAQQAVEAGMDGIIAAATDLERIRPILHDNMEIITPGIRPVGVPVNDQKRVMTPGDAIRAGADRIVVGRPITTAEQPERIVSALLEEIGHASEQEAKRME